MEEMRSVQSHGPYYLIGHSAGGLIAFEMAHQLTAMGEKVAFLGLLDTHAPDPAWRPRRLPFVHVCRNLLRMRPRVLLKFVTKLMRDEIEAMPLVRSAMIKFLPTPSTLRLRLVSVSEAPYEPMPYPGRIHLFQSTTPGHRIRTEPPPPPEVGWRSLALGGLDVHSLPGGHMDVVKDPLAVFTADAIESAVNALGDRR